MFLIQIIINIHLAYIVEQIEIEVLHLTFLQLLRENFFNLRHVCQIVSRELIRQIEALPGIFLQGPAHNQLGITS